MGAMRRLLLAVLAAIAVMPLMSATAQAAGCYGDWCSGKDPAATGCARDAVTVASVPLTYASGSLSAGPGVVSGSVDIGGDVYGELELRWSPTCKTNWARMRTWRTNQVFMLYTTQDTGYRQVRRVSGRGAEWTPPGDSYTWMIYSPARSVRAHVSGGPASPPISTTWV
ncbi:DUF2690 domain-containing protein [Candidatus Saccharibacteria bacterium]|nr:DUF2690 domain-containing protein [Candidatus Saccharibacteria bacterium]